MPKRILLAVALVSSTCVHAQTNAAMDRLVKTLEGSRIDVVTPEGKSYQHLVKSYTHVRAEGCTLHYLETADDSGTAGTRHGEFTFTINLGQVAEPSGAIVPHGTAPNDFYSVPLKFKTEQTILQERTVNGVPEEKVTLKHLTASFEVSGAKKDSLRMALNAGIQACSLR